MKTFLKLILGVAIGIALSFTACAVFGESWALGGILLLCGLLVLACALMSQRRRSLPLVLAFGLACDAMAQEAPQPIQPAGAPIAVGIGLGLLIGGGYVCVRVVRACAKRKHYPTNAPPDAASAPTGNYAGLMTYQPDYCIEPASIEENNGVVLDVEVVNADDTQPVLHQSCRTVPPTALVDFDTFDRQLALWGLSYDGLAGEHYAKNGKPIDPSKVPFAFTAAWWNAPGVAIYPERPLFHVEIATSRDMQSWTRLADLWLPAATPVQILDNPSGDQSFYRLKLVGE